MRIKTFVFLIILFFAHYQLFTQTKGLPVLDPEKLMGRLADRDILKNRLFQQEQFPSANIINAEYYKLGPGDVLILQVLPAFMNEEVLTVTPENSVIIPRIGTIDVKGKTLKELKDTINQIFINHNPQNKVYLSLYQPRLVFVTIRGNVSYPGNYYLPASYTVSTAIRFANDFIIKSEIPQQQAAAMLKILSKKYELEQNYSETGLPFSINYSERYTTVFHKDGTSEIVDIIKSETLGDYSADPYLMEGDIINVPFPNLIFPTISVLGSILNPSVIPYKNGDKLSMLVKLAKGIKENANLENIVLYTPQNPNGTKIQINENLELLSGDIELTEGSILIFGEKPLNQPSNYGSVSIKGEVKKPGVYLVENNQTRLKEVIEKAGGFSENAYLPLAKILRRNGNEISKTDPMNIVKQYFQYSDLTLDDTIRYILDIDQRKSVVSCDFESAFVKNSEKDNVLLQDGDVILVPNNPRTVYVFGQVNQPGFVEFSENKNMKWYIEKAGGFAPNARKSRARIIRGNTLVWLEGNDDVYLNAGDMVYVPRPPDIPSTVEIQNYGLIASIALTFVTVISIITNLLSR